MHFNRDGKLIRTDIWREGKYLDLWSVPHFLSGMAVAFVLFFLDFDIRSAAVIAFLVFVAYEMFEVIVKIEETRWNRILDVVVGMVSFVPTFFIATMLAWNLAVLAFVVVTVLDATLSFFGWLASRKAAILEEKFIQEFQRERLKFRERRTAFSTDWKNRRARWRSR